MQTNQPPHGFRFQDGNLVIDPENASTRRLLFKLFLKHGSQAKVATLLNEKGLTTRVGKPFTGNAVKRSLQCQSARGTYKGLTCEPLVDEDTWNRAQALLQNSKPGRCATHPFTGIIFCECGSKMYVATASPKWQTTL